MLLSIWSITSGDLRTPHFFAPNMIRAEPAAGLVIGVLAPVLTRRRLLPVLVALWTFQTVFTFHQASPWSTSDISPYWAITFGCIRQIIIIIDCKGGRAILKCDFLCSTMG